MNRYLTIIAATIAVVMVGTWFGMSQVSGQGQGIHREQGGLRMVVPSSGSLDIESGGELDIEASADLILTGEVRHVPTDTVPTAVEGQVYWDDSENAMKHHNGTSFVAITAGSGDNTLDNAYDQGGAGAGKKVEVDNGAVELEVDDTSNNPALHLDGDDVTNDPTVLLIENVADAANAITIDIDAQTTGRDIEGTGASWHVTGAGVLTASDAQLTTATVSGTLTQSNVTFGNGGTINNDTNNEIEFSENSEELSFAFTSNTVTYATDTAIDAFAFGVVDDLSGIGTLAFDAAASTVTLASDGAAQDLTIQVTGAQNSSLVLTSAGTAADAMQLTTTAGGIDITNGGAAGGEDIDIAGTLASVNITSAESVADAIKVESTLGGVDILASGAAAGEDIDIVATGSSVNVTATEDVATSIVLSSSNGGIDITAASAAAGEDIDISSTGSSVNLSADEADAAAISIQASGGGIDVDAVDDIIITVASSAGADDFRLIQTGAFDASISAEAAGTGTDAIRLQASAGGIDIDAVDDINIAVASNAGADDLNIVQTGAVDSSILLTAAGTGTDAIGLTASAGGITLSAASGDINVVHDLDVDAAIVGDGGGAVTGMLLDVTDDTDGKTVLIAESGGIETNAGAGGGQIWNLPEASTAIGMQFTFVVMAAQNLDINPDDADIILTATNAAGDALRSATVGDTVTIAAVDATNWVVISMYPTNTDWTDAD